MKKFALSIILLCNVCMLAQAETRAYALLDLGYNDWQIAGKNSSFGISIGGGLSIFEFASFEIAYNDYGQANFDELDGDEIVLVKNASGFTDVELGLLDISDLELSARSYSFSGHFGIKIGSVRPFVVVGAEEITSRVEGIIKKDLVILEINEDDKEIEGIFGIGLDLFTSEDNTVSGRIKLTAHGDGSEDIYRLTIGIALGT